MLEKVSRFFCFYFKARPVFIKTSQSLNHAEKLKVSDKGEVLLEGLAVDQAHHIHDNLAELILALGDGTGHVKEVGIGGEGSLGLEEVEGLHARDADAPILILGGLHHADGREGAKIAALIARLRAGKDNALLEDLKRPLVHGAAQDSPEHGALGPEVPQVWVKTGEPIRGLLGKLGPLGVEDAPDYLDVIGIRRVHVGAPKLKRLLRALDGDPIEDGLGVAKVGKQIALKEEDDLALVQDKGKHGVVRGSRAERPERA